MNKNRLEFKKLNRGQMGFFIKVYCFMNLDYF